MKILVTGGTGFLGKALVLRLVELGHKVRVLDNGFRSSKERLSTVVDEIELLEGDIRDPKTVDESVKGCDAVIHLAAINGTEFFYSKPDLVLDVGVRGILNIIDSCQKHGVDKLLAASSSEVYQSPTKIPTDESAPLIIPDIMNPRYSYGGAKIATELLVVNQCKKDFSKALCFRPHNVYGPEMGWEHVLPQLILKTVDAIEANPSGPVPLTIQGNGEETRAFMHIDDMIDGILILLEKGEHLNIYHVGNPEEISITEVAKKIVQSFGRECELHTGPLQPGSTRRRCPDIQKIQALGYQPKISLDEGLPTIIEWYVANAKKRKLAEV